MSEDPTSDTEIPIDSSPTLAGLTREFRRLHGLTIDQLALLLDVDPASVRRYESTSDAPQWVTYALLGLDYSLQGNASTTRAHEPPASAIERGQGEGRPA